MALGKIFRNERKNESITREDNKARTKNFKQTVMNATSKFNGYFQTSGDLFFSASSNESLKNIGITIYIDNFTYNASDPSMLVNMRVGDSELNKTYASKLFEKSKFDVFGINIGFAPETDEYPKLFPRLVLFIKDVLNDVIKCY
ncbi:1214_t:CDS:2 [Gigaspora margarita]|uniref:1214_t:CDS:1 n=1 Tax=Gigaspora margarita TaxID=4874 RepID=A0ABN7UQ68_GIGMA|nr:1214_t:CDS:2 [Gigaspora margarita]